ncbi:unnamed protein product [Symbiodinium pilosum]|uniref:Thyroglobulin type-1 domain-containing protein n=1 Tax=Symbiodinium pilosum TaxID=2952 RepID=A0A812TNL2_SYMPI|nr:unnamed protein product [Symbiodinium pilosum]
MQVFEVESAPSAASTPARGRCLGILTSPRVLLSALLAGGALVGLFALSHSNAVSSQVSLVGSQVGSDQPQVCQEGGEVMPGHFRPRCTEDGFWAPHQCDGSTGMCWCSDKAGHRLEGSLSKPGQHSTRHEDCLAIRLLQEDGNNTECHLKQLKARIRPLLGAFLPRCRPEGGYEKHQCWGSTGECWCTDASGKEVAGTRGRPGPKAEECASSCQTLCTAEHQQQGVNCILGACLHDETTISV